MHEGLLYSTHSLHHLSFFPYYMNTMKKKKKKAGACEQQGRIDSQGLGSSTQHRGSLCVTATCEVDEEGSLSS